jgi:uncharacterized protein HemX
MRCLQLVVVIGLGLASTAWAGSDHPRLQSATRAVKPLPKVRQRVTRSQAEVKRLEQDVARQESDSKQANERLQQQDQAIAELQKQLHELQAKPVAGQH